MSNEDVLDQSIQDENSSIDVKSLLEVANSKAFDDEYDLLKKDKSFEKASSFFDLIKSSSADQVELSEQTQDTEASKENLLDEQVAITDGSSKEDSDDGVIDVEKNEKSEHELIADELPDEDIVSEIEIEKTAEDEESSEEDFQPINVIEQSRETVEKLKSEDEQDSDQLNEKSEEYSRGYQDALIEFEKTLQVEKEAISNFGNTLLSIRDDASKIIEELIKEKVIEIAQEFLGFQISDFPEKFLLHIEDVSASIIANNNEILLELNELDAAALKTITELEKLAFGIKEVTDLGRGEFRMFVGKSGYEQRIID